MGTRWSTTPGRAKRRLVMFTSVLLPATSQALFGTAFVFATIGCQGEQRDCRADGRSRSHGERWTCADGCNGCACDDGKLVRTNKYCLDSPDAQATGTTPADAGVRDASADDAAVVPASTSECPDLPEDECLERGCSYLRGAEVLVSDAGCVYGDTFGALAGSAPKLTRPT